MKNTDKELLKKVSNLFWELPPEIKEHYVEIILSDPKESLIDKSLFLKVLSGLDWFDLNKLLTNSELYDLLTDDLLNRIFPFSLQNYYKDAKRLLQKYSLSPTR